MNLNTTHAQSRTFLAFFCEVHKKLKSSCTFLLSPPNSGGPHVTISPSARIAAKAPFCVASNRNTLQLRSGGDLSSAPQVTMDPSAFTTPKVCSLAQSCFTLVNICWTASLLPPLVGSPHVTTLTPVTAAKALIVPWISSTFRSKGSTSLPGWWTDGFPVEKGFVIICPSFHLWGIHKWNRLK